MNRNIEYIFVDLDGTLIRTDLFLESAFQLLKRNPLKVFHILLWLLQGRATAKERIAASTDLDLERLPFEPTLLDYIQEQKEQGLKIVLATASHRRHAEQVAGHLGLFDHIIATEAGVNLKSHRKLEAIREYIGDADFAYAGDSSADRPIWKAATANILVNAPRKDVRLAEASNKAEKVITSAPSVWRAFLEGMRPHQYAKNTLVFIPLIASHGYQGLPAVYAVLLAFVCFSFCASGAYFLNDLLDIESDRLHARKRNRPLASGSLPLSVGVLGAIALPSIAFGVAWLSLPKLFVGVLAAYFLLTNAYSFALKRISTVDVMALAVLYTLRVVAGAAAISITLSFWLVAFSMFLFVSLAYLKRYIEVAELSKDGDKAHGRGYSAADCESMFSLGTANITAAVMVLAFYINSDEVTQLYASPDTLWLICLLMLYWGNRIWVGARRGKIADDPVVFVLKDNVSRLVGVLFVIVVLAARYVEI